MQSGQTVSHQAFSSSERTRKEWAPPAQEQSSREELGNDALLNGAELIPSQLPDSETNRVSIQIFHCRSDYTTCHIWVADSGQRLPAICVADEYYSFFRVEPTKDLALQTGNRLVERGDRIVVTRIPKGYTLWVFEPDAQVASLFPASFYEDANPYSRARPEEDFMLSTSPTLTFPTFTTPTGSSAEVRKAVRTQDDTGTDETASDAFRAYLSQADQGEELDELGTHPDAELEALGELNQAAIAPLSRTDIPYRVLTSRRQYTKAWVMLPGLDQAVQAVMFEQEYYSLFKRVSSIKQTAQIVKKLSLRGDKTVVTRMTQGYGVWIMEPNAIPQ